MINLSFQPADWAIDALNGFFFPDFCALRGWVEALVVITNLLGCIGRALLSFRLRFPKIQWSGSGVSSPPSRA